MFDTRASHITGCSHTIDLKTEKGLARRPIVLPLQMIEKFK